ncbi:MAG TPA: YeeE/YedE thiosulfate transporter family protein [Polyangiaceae bacterium]
MSHFTPGAALAGGLLLGIAASLLFVVDGRILGISGIVGEIPARAGDRGWRLVFLAGLAVGALVLRVVAPSTLAGAGEQTVGVALAAGVLVGVGTRMSNGCTSGHGLCGLARFSRRSLVATGVFMATAAITVFVVRHVLHAGGAS